MNIPSTIQAGDTLSWTDTVPSRPATAGWTLYYTLYRYGAAPVTFTATPSGDAYAFAIPATDSGKLEAGTWNYSAYVSNAGGEKYTVGRGQVTVKPDYSQATPASDFRYGAEKLLADIDAAIARLASREVTSVTVQGRTVTYRELGSLLADRDRLRNAIKQEEDAARVAAGESVARKIYTRFSS